MIYHIIQQYMHLFGSSSDNDMLDATKEALQDDSVVAGLAKPIASVVTETIATRLNAVDKSLRDEDNKFK